MQVWSLVKELDPTCCRAAKPRCRLVHSVLSLSSTLDKPLCRNKDPAQPKEKTTHGLANSSALPSPRCATCQPQQDLFFPHASLSQVHQHSCLYLLTKTSNHILSSSPGPSTLCMNPSMTLPLLAPGCHSAGGRKKILVLLTGQVFDFWVQWGLCCCESGMFLFANCLQFPFSKLFLFKSPLTHCPSISAAVLQSNFTETVRPIKKETGFTFPPCHLSLPNPPPHVLS